jgi:hypothetical protein
VPPTPTPTLPNPCTNIPNAQPLPALGNNTGYWCTIRLTTSAVILGGWADNSDSNDQIMVYLNNPGPFVGRPDPSTLDPNNLTSFNNQAFDFRGSTLFGITPCLGPGTYSVYFYNRGSATPASLASVLTFTPTDCGP